MQHEFVIGNNNHLYWVRFRKMSLPFVILLCLLLLFFFRNGFNEAIMYVGPLFLLLLGGLFLLPRRVLYRVVFDRKTKQVTVDIAEFNRVKNRHVIPFEAFSAFTKYSIMGRDTLWFLHIYANNKQLYKQVTTYGWSLEDFYAIEDLSKALCQHSQ